MPAAKGSARTPLGPKVLFAAKGMIAEETRLVSNKLLHLHYYLQTEGVLEKCSTILIDFLKQERGVEPNN